MLKRTLLSVLVVMLAECLLPAQAPPLQAPGPKNVNLPGALSRVRFTGPVPTLEALDGKSCVVMVYASWCPKCNEWSPELFAQLKAAAVEKPVVVFAINADQTTRGVRYAVERGLVGPNIVHGDDPTIVKRLGLDSELFKFAVFNPQGQLAELGNGGSFYSRGQQKDFVIANKIREGKIPGEFALLSLTMSDPVKEALWPVEMGQPVTDKSLLKLRAGLPEDNQDEFNQAIRGFLDKRLSQCEAAASGDAPAQIKAYQLAGGLAKSFGTTPQGRQAKAIVAKFEESTQFKKEIAAGKYYERTMQTGGTPAAMRRALMKVANRFEGTYYGDLAAKTAQSEDAAGGE